MNAIEIKGLTIQSALEDLIKNYIFENLDCIISDNGR